MRDPRHWAADVADDVRLAWRLHRRHPSHALLVVLTFVGIFGLAGVLSATILSVGAAPSTLDAEQLDPLFVQRLRWLLGGVGALILLNMLTLELTRSILRRQELAIRVAVGATPSRLVRQLGTEAVFVSLVAACAALLLAAGFLTTTPRLAAGVQSDWFTMLALVLGAVLLAAVSAVACHLRASDIAVEIRSGTHVTPPARGLARLVAVHLLICIVFVATGSRILNDVLDRPDPVSAAHRASVIAVEPQGEGRARLEELLASFEMDERVDAVAFASTLPRSRLQRIDSVRAAVGEPRDAEVIRVTPGFLERFGSALMTGRTFGHADTAGGPNVAVVTTALAERLWGRVDPVGRSLAAGSSEYRVIGVVRDPLPEWGRNQIVYLAALQHAPANGSVMLWSVPDAAGDEIAVASAVMSGFTVLSAEPYREFLDRSHRPYHYLGRVAVAAAALQLLLLAVGLYGVLSCAIERRTAEIGIRRALGASRRHIAILILRDIGRLALGGLAAGVLSAWVLGRYLAGGPGDVREITPLLVAGSALAVVVALATFLPAMRALRTPCSSAMRQV